MKKFTFYSCLEVSSIVLAALLVPMILVSGYMEDFLPSSIGYLLAFFTLSSLPFSFLLLLINIIVRITKKNWTNKKMLLFNVFLLFVISLVLSGFFSEIWKYLFILIYA